MELSSSVQAADPAGPSGDLIAHVQDLREKEKIRLSRALHDDLGGLLVSASMDLGWIEQHLTEDGLRERLKRVRGALAAAIDLKRNLIEELRPTLLDNFGLFAAYRWHVKHLCHASHITCSDHYPSEELNLSGDASSNLFRIMQECLSMVVAEEGVVSIDVDVSVADEALILRTTHTHETAETSDVYRCQPAVMGTLTERVNRFGGRIAVERGPAESTVLLQFPLRSILASA